MADFSFEECGVNLEIRHASNDTQYRSSNEQQKFEKKIYNNFRHLAP